MPELDMLSHNLPRDKKQLFSDNPIGNFVAIQSLETFQRVHKDFKPKPTDVYVSSYPKNGTTWTIALVDQLLKIYNPEHQIPKGITGGIIFSSCPWIEGLAMNETRWNESCLSYLENMKEPRVFKTHSAEKLIPESGVEGVNKRLIQVMRNPLDTFVSAWHHIYGKKNYQGSFDRFFEKVVLEDGFENGSWFEYHEEFFKAQEENRIDVLFLKYEDMKVDDGEEAIQKISDFLGLEIDFDAKKIAAECNFGNMKEKSNKFGFITPDRKPGDATKWADSDPGSKDKPSNAHIRKGIVGDWKNYYNEDQLKQWEEYVEEACKKYVKTAQFFGKDYFFGRI